jgi:DNA-binding protein H-NS
MSDSIKVLNNMRILRAHSRDVDLQTLEEMYDKLKIVVEERRQELQTTEAEQKEHKEKLERFREMLLSDGIDPAELMSGNVETKPKKRRTPRPAKYQYTDEGGTIRTWTGQGRTPKAIAMQIAAGASLESFEVASDSETE